MARRFIGDVVARWLTHGGPDRDMELVDEFQFEDSDGKIWTAPQNAKINGASIPSALWSFGPPYVGDYRRASVVHDYYCDAKTETWQDTHYMFYEACREGGVGKTLAKAMYFAVYVGGPRWPAPRLGFFGRVLKSSPSDAHSGDQIPPRPDIDAEEFQSMLDWIENEDPEIDEIVARSDAMMSPAVT